MQHVLLSIVLLQDDFLNGKKDDPKNNIEDRVSVLSIAYHNLGVEFEYLQRVIIYKNKKNAYILLILV